MAVKASIQITISKVIDVYAVYRYYKLQSSTLAKPSKPTTNPPSGWSDTEPAYVSGSTNTLYFVDCNVYSDMSFSFSEVSKSSSYEAAKDAWNKANNAQNTADDAKQFTDNAKNNYGYQYKYDITLNGDTNKYYPVVILGGNQNVMREIMVTRGYLEKAPAEWNGHPTAKGIALLLKLKCNFGGWGGAAYQWWIHDLTEQYGNVFASAETCMSYMGFAIFLRGGGDTGAVYHIYSDQALETTIYNGTGPKAYYNSDRIGWTGGTSDNPTYSWNAPAPRTLTDSVKKQIESKKYIQMAVNAISDVDVEYYLSTSATSLAGGSWSTTAPTWVNGKYMWSRTVTVDGAGNKTYSPNQNGVCIAGAKGNTGSTGAAGKGVTSIVEQYYKSTSATSLSGGSWGTTYPGWENGKYIWTRSVITYTDSTTTTTTAVCVTGTKGDTGAKGDAGANGKSIGSVVNYYLATSVSSNVTTSTSGWTTTVQSVSSSKKYLWNYEVIKYSDGTNAAITTPCIIGAYGDTGSKGDTGATGKGISKITEHYAVSTSNSTIPTSWSSTVPTLTATNKYLWNYETITYTDNTTADTTKRVIGVYGDKGDTGTTGKGVKSSAVTYQTSSSGTTTPTGTWSSTVPATTAEKPYLWSRTIIMYTDNTTTTTYVVGSTPEGVLDEIQKVLRYDDTTITLGKTGDSTTLTLRNDGLNIQKDQTVMASFGADKLTLGKGYLSFRANGYDTMLTCDPDYANKIKMFLPNQAVSDKGDAASLTMWNGGTYYGVGMSSETATIGAYHADAELIADSGNIALMNADNIRLTATKSLTYDIPVVTNTDCDTLIRSGKWYIGIESTNRPTTTNGWLETLAYSDNYCKQTYTTHLGDIYTRTMQAKTWGSWSRVYSPTQTVLWSGSTYPKAADTAVLSEPISAQANGIVIFFQWYGTGTPAKSDMICHYIPKYLVANFDGGYTISAIDYGGAYAMSKYLYIGDTAITGSDFNGDAAKTTDSGIKITNWNYIMTRIVGV